MQTFSLNSAVLEDIFRYAKPLGHHEKHANLSLGLGFLYYGVARTLRPKHIVVISSGLGFSVVCLAETSIISTGTGGWPWMVGSMPLRTSSWC